MEGLDAKPIVDLMPVVQRLGAVDARAEALRALGYEYLGSSEFQDGGTCAREGRADPPDAYLSGGRY